MHRTGIYMAADTPTSALANPLDYPFDIWPRCFVLDGGQATPISLESAPLAEITTFKSVVKRFRRASTDPTVLAALDIERPMALLSCGSNASPRRLAEKLNRSKYSKAAGVRISTDRFAPCYAAALSYYGSIPATFAVTGRPAFPFLVITDHRNLEAIVESETRTGNFDLYRSTADGVTFDAPVYAFLCKFGALRVDGELAPLAEFQPAPGGMTQRQIAAAVLKELGSPLDVPTYEQALGDPGFRTALRHRIIADFKQTTGLAGFEYAH